jgi:hypothetical protein
MPNMTNSARLYTVVAVLFFIAAVVEIGTALLPLWRANGGLHFLPLVWAATCVGLGAFFWTRRVRART